MTASRTRLVNYAAYQAGWIAAVGGAAVGWPGTGAAIAGVLTLGHLGLTTERRREATLVAIAIATGLVVERQLIAAGTYRLFGGGPVGVWPPLWLIALWAQFATTWRYSLAGVFARPWAAALLGGAGGPIAFLAGERLGAVVLWAPVLPGLVRLAVAWAVALVWLAVVTRVVGRGAPGRYRG